MNAHQFIYRFIGKDAVVLQFQEYKKQLNETDADYEDTAAALQLVLQAASHANEMMKKLVILFSLV